MQGQTEGYLTQAQLRKIWVSARELGWTDAKVHEELERVIGVTSLRNLSGRDAKLFIDFMVSEGATSGRHFAPSSQVNEQRPDPTPSNVIELATPAQQQYVDELLLALGWNRQTDYFLGCLKKATGRTGIRTRKEASAAITLLKTMMHRILEQAPEATPPGEGEARGA